MPPRGAISQPLFKVSASAEDLAAWVLAYARREEMFAAGDRVLVAVSGGPDSVALLHLLHRLRSELGLDLGVGLFDHGLRGAESREDATFVAGLAATLGLPFHPGQGEVKALARAEKVSLQMAGRKLRLSFLRETCRAHAYDKLALGHTADDQVELFFLRLLRGAGPEGLKGMWPATPEGLVRPLLAVGKEVILAWLNQESLPYRQDLSNLSRRYLRNRVRLDLLPDLKRRYNPRLCQAVWRTQAFLQEEERLLSQETERVWATVGKAVARDFFSLDLPGFFRLDPFLQKRLLRAAVARLRPDGEMTSSQVAGLLALARGGRSGGVISLGETLRVARAGPELHFFRRLPDPPGDAVTLIPASPHGVKSPEGWNWRLSTRPYNSDEPRPPTPDTARVDLDKVTFPLQVRYFRPGDRFWPQGAPGPKKLQDFLVDSKIPRWLRAHLPLMASAGQIIWVAGLRVGDPAKVTPASRTVLEIKVSPSNPEAQRLWDIILACRPPATG